MKICYVDESGCTGKLPTATSPIQPLFVISGIVFDHSQINEFTKLFLQLKKQFFPRHFKKDSRLFLDGVLAEIKGSELRKHIASDSRKQRRHAIGFLDKVFDLLEEFSCKLTGRVWIKGVGMPFKGRSIYTYSIQCICTNLNKTLSQENDIGIILSDSRNFTGNVQVAHSIFTKKFRNYADEYDRLVELPTFVHSDNHAGIQVSDLINSAILFPMASHAYCMGTVRSCHVKSGFWRIRERYHDRVKTLQLRYQDSSGQCCGGITVSNPLTKRPGCILFSAP